MISPNFLFLNTHFHFKFAHVVIIYSGINMSNAFSICKYPMNLIIAFVKNLAQLWIGSHTTTNISIFIMIYATKVPVKNGNKRLYPAKITCELQLCATPTTSSSFQNYSDYVLFKSAILKLVVGQ